MKKFIKIFSLCLLMLGLASCEECSDCDYIREDGEYWIKTNAVFHILNTNTDLYSERINGYGRRYGTWLRFEDGTKAYLSNGSYVMFEDGY